MSFAANDIWNSWASGGTGSGPTQTVTDGVLKIDDASSTASSYRYLKVTLKGGDTLLLNVMARAISGQGTIFINSVSLPGTDVGTAKITGKTDFQQYSVEYSVPHIYSAVDIYIGLGTLFADLGVVEFFAPNLYVNGCRISYLNDTDFGVSWSSVGGVVRAFGVNVLDVQKVGAADKRVAVTRSTITGDPFALLGTLSPVFRVNGNSNDTSSAAVSSFVNNTSGPTFLQLKTRSATMGVFSATQTGDALGACDFFGDNGTAYTRSARIEALQFAAVGSGLVPGLLNFRLTTPTSLNEVAMVLTPGAWRPGVDATYNLASAGLRFNNSFFAVAPTVTSDERSKQDISMIDDCVLDAWATIEYQQYRLRQAVDLKGGDARTHIGLIAQSIESAFVLAGLDPFELGILCYDEWPDQEEVMDVWADEFDDEGELVRAAGREITQPFVPAGSRYGVRYEEALALEAALMRRTTQRLEARLADLESA